LAVDRGKTGHCAMAALASEAQVAPHAILQYGDVLHSNPGVVKVSSEFGFGVFTAAIDLKKEFVAFGVLTILSIPYRP